MSRGRRYDSEPKLNIKKVIAVIIAIAVIVMFVLAIKGLLSKDETSGKITSQSYFAAYKDNKWGVINQEGEYVIDPSYQEMIIIPNNKQGVFICNYDVNYTTEEYKTKVLNAENKEIFTEYDKVEALQNKDENNNLWYEEEVLKVEKDGKYGLIDFTGKEVISIEYDEISVIDGIENSFKVKKDDKYGIVDSDGKVVVEPQYADIDILGKDNKSGFIFKNDSGKYGIIDYSNNIVLEANYDGIEKVYGNDMYVVTVSGKQRLVNKAGEDVLTTGFDSIKQILSNQTNSVIYVKSSKYGVMNTSGEVLVNASYDDLKEAKSGILIAKQNGKYGIINISNEQKLAFDYSSITYNEKADIYIADDSDFNSNLLNSEFETKLTGILSELNTDKGYIKLSIDNNYKYYNFKFEEKQEIELFPNRTLFLNKQDGKYGYVDKNGKVIIDYIYDDATEQNDYGYVAVKKDGKWGSIDSKGNIIQEPTYDLEDYLLIDFIGRWHLGLDVNMNSYNQL